MRDETDLDTLGGELVGVVEETVRPAHAALWLREAGREGETGQKTLGGGFVTPLVTAGRRLGARMSGKEAT